MFTRDLPIQNPRTLNRLGEHLDGLGFEYDGDYTTLYCGWTPVGYRFTNHMAYDMANHWLLRRLVLRTTVGQLEPMEA